MNKDTEKLRMLYENLDKKLVYHVTSKRYLPSIYQNGLKLNSPEDYAESGDELGIYCFPSIQEAENALYNWLGERIEEWEEENQTEYDEIVLVLNISGLSVKEAHDIDWEIIVKEPISPDRIVDLIVI